MRVSTVDLETAAGTDHTQLVTPDGAGPWPAIILCTDAGGQRPAMLEIAGMPRTALKQAHSPDLRLFWLRDLAPNWHRREGA